MNGRDQLRIYADTHEVMGFPTIAARVRERSCGKCQLCCQVLGVDSIDSQGRQKFEGITKAYERCAHQCERRGCAIYQDRPKLCAAYVCAWRMGYGDESHRPDGLGVVADVQAHPDGDCAIGVIRADHPPADLDAVIQFALQLASEGPEMLRHVGFVCPCIPGGKPIPCVDNPRAIAEYARVWNAHLEKEHACER